MTLKRSLVKQAERSLLLRDIAFPEDMVDTFVEIAGVNSDQAGYLATFFISSF